MAFVIWGVYVIDVWPTIFGVAVVYLSKLWFLDRMVWLCEDMKDATPEYRNWLYGALMPTRVHRACGPHLLVLLPFWLCTSRVVFRSEHCPISRAGRPGYPQNVACITHRNISPILLFLTEISTLCSRVARAVSETTLAGGRNYRNR